MRITSTYLLFIVALLSISCEQDLVKEEIETPSISDKLLYSKNPNGHNELYLLRDGEEIRLLSDPDYDYWWPKVSPDKEQFLVYRSKTNPDKNHDDYENAELLLVDINGKNQKVIIKKNQYNWNAQGVCRWNKDGSKILMCAEVEVEDGLQWRLVTTDIDGDNPKMLSDTWALDCNFSNDDEHIVFMGFTDNKLSFDLTKLELQIGKYDSGKNTVTDIRALTSNSTRDHDPDYSPDGTKIIFSAGNALYSNVDLHIYDFETEEETSLLDDQNANGGSMCWSTNGEYIYFHSLALFKSPFKIKGINIETKELFTILEVEDNSHGFFHPEAF